MTHILRAAASQFATGTDVAGWSGRGPELPSRS